MFNPWLILAAVLAIGAAGVGGYFKGSTDAKNAAAAQYAKDLDAKVAEHNANALIDMTAAREAGERDAKARTRTVTVTNEVERVIHAAPAPAVCRLTPDTFNLLRAAIDIANDADTPAAKSMPDAAPKTKPAGKPGSGLDHAVFVSGDRAIWATGER